MAKADVSTEVLVLLVVGVGLVTVYSIYEVSRLTTQAGAAAQKPFRWFAEGSEFWADTVTFWDNETNGNGRTLTGKDPNSWGWGYGPKKGWLLG